MITLSIVRLSSGFLPSKHEARKLVFMADVKRPPPKKMTERDGTKRLSHPIVFHHLRRIEKNVVPRPDSFVSHDADTIARPLRESHRSKVILILVLVPI